jgi:hypothetical protein
VGWASPANWAGLSPKRVGPISAQQFTLFIRVWAGPSLDIRAGPENKMGGGLFSPSHPPACRAILHAGETYATKLSKSGGARRGTKRGGGSALLVRLLH